jgi:hypothetical protein
VIFPVKDALQYAQDDGLYGQIRPFMPEPLYGATYLLSEDVQMLKEIRKEKEKEILK